jgi:hypothetical protein
MDVGLVPARLVGDREGGAVELAPLRGPLTAPAQIFLRDR